MKKALLSFSFLLALMMFSNEGYSQSQNPPPAEDSTDNRIYVVTKNDGTVFVGRILKRDAREILMETKELGQVIIPKHEIKEIRELKPGEMNSRGDFIGREIFSTRYFLTTNGLPIEKGESYVQWNLYGPDIQFGIGRNFSAGLMTTWIGSPLIGTAKYSFSLAEKTHFSIGVLAGTGSWASPDFGITLPFGALTFGDRVRNINLSAGYGSFFMDGDHEGRTLLSVGAMTKVGKKISLVFDSFILPPTTTNDGIAVLVPGFRLQTQQNRAFQFGFAAIYAENELIPFPFPMLQWYQKL